MLRTDFISRTLHTKVAFFQACFKKELKWIKIKNEGKNIDDDDNKSFIISSHANYGAKPMIKMYKSMCLTQQPFFVFLYRGVDNCKMARWKNQNTLHTIISWSSPFLNVYHT